jgi:beta-phosphoglucomutase-like phosphatase (HAD superfamily)
MIVVVFLKVQKIGSIMPLVVPNSSTTVAPWEDVLKLFKEVKLSSSKFAAWSSQQQLNAKTQLQSLRLHEQFQAFVTNALHIESN